MNDPISELNSFCQQNKFTDVPRYKTKTYNRNGENKTCAFIWFYPTQESTTEVSYETQYYPTGKEAKIEAAKYALRRIKASTQNSTAREENEISLEENEISLEENDEALEENEISLEENDEALEENDEAAPRRMNAEAVFSDHDAQYESFSVQLNVKRERLLNPPRWKIYVDLSSSNNDAALSNLTTKQMLQLAKTGINIDSNST